MEGEDVRAMAPSAVDVMERVMQGSGKYAGDAAGDAVRRLIAALRTDGWRVDHVGSALQRISDQTGLSVEELDDLLTDDEKAACAEHLRLLGMLRQQAEPRHGHEAMP